MLQARKIRRSGDFLWPATDVDVQPRGAERDGTVRSIDMVPSEEIIAAFELVLRHSLSLQVDDLVTETARLLGYNRTGPAIKSRLMQELEQADAVNRLQRVNDRYQLP